MKDCPNCWGYQEYNGEMKSVTVGTTYNRKMPTADMNNTMNKEKEQKI